MSKIAFIFPGQGAQTTGMGQDFYQETETGREMFEKASEILGLSMTDLCFDPAQTDRLNITEYTQPGPWSPLCPPYCSSSSGRSGCRRA